MPTLTRTDEPVPFKLPKIIGGAGWQFTLALANADGTAMDLTGKTLSMQMREKVSDSAALFTPVVTVAVAASGEVVFTIAHALTAAVTQAKTLIFSLLLAQSGSEPLALMEGTVAFEPAITR